MVIRYLYPHLQYDYTKHISEIYLLYYDIVGFYYVLHHDTMGDIG